MIQIVEQCIPTPTTQQWMDAIYQYAKRTSLTKVIGGESTRATVYIRGWYCGGGRHGGGWVSGQGNECQKHKYTYYKMDNHTSKACGKRHYTEDDSNKGDKHICRNNEQAHFIKKKEQKRKSIILHTYHHTINDSLHQVYNKLTPQRLSKYSQHHTLMYICH